MANATVRAVEALRIDPVELAHAAAEIGRRGLDQKMIVIVHEAIGVAGPALPLDRRREQREESPPVVVVEKDRGPRIAPRHDVIDRAWILYA